MYLSYSAVLKNNTLNWLNESPQDDDVEVIVTILPKSQPKQPQWQWLDKLRTLPNDESFTKVILESRQHLIIDERDWSVFQ